jgi:NAD(P)H dehydrogenase (quinone)
MSASRRTLLVTGASGQLGRLVLDQLLEHKSSARIIAATRTPEKLAAFAERGVEVRMADFDSATSLARAFEGAERLLLISTGHLFPEGLRLSQHRAAVKAAVSAGVQHVLYTSGPSPHPTPAGSLINDHYWTEQALAASPLEWTILRHHLYTETLVGALATALKHGELASSAGDGGNNYVTRGDCARADAAALASDWSGRRILDVTGPSPVTQAELASIVTELTGRPLRYKKLTRDEHAKLLAAAGLPPFVIDAVLGFNQAAARGYHEVNAPTVAELTGRPPISVQSFLAAHRDALATS